MQNRQTISVALWLIIFLVGIYILMTWTSFEWPPVKPTYTVTTGPGTATNTVIPPPEMGFEAITITNARCVDWSYQTLTEINELEKVSVLGRNRDSSWYMVRWPKFTTPCWVEAAIMKRINFNPEELFMILSPFPPASTGTPTSVFIPVVSATQVSVQIVPAMQTKATDSDDRISIPQVDTLKTPTDAPKPPPDTPKPPPDTPKPPPDTPKPPTNPPPTDAPSGPRECNDGVDNDGDNNIDFPADSGCRNKGDNSE